MKSTSKKKCLQCCGFYSREKSANQLTNQSKDLVLSQDEATQVQVDYVPSSNQNTPQSRQRTVKHKNPIIKPRLEKSIRNSTLSSHSVPIPSREISKLSFFKNVWFENSVLTFPLRMQEITAFTWRIGETWFFISNFKNKSLRFSE